MEVGFKLEKSETGKEAKNPTQQPSSIGILLVPLQTQQYRSAPRDYFDPFFASNMERILVLVLIPNLIK